MLLKIIAGTFVVATVGRLFFRRQWRDLGKWFQRAVDLTLVVLAIVLAAQWIVIATK
jgi:hypothetical protein